MTRNIIPINFTWIHIFIIPIKFLGTYKHLLNCYKPFYDDFRLIGVDCQSSSPHVNTLIYPRVLDTCQCGHIYCTESRSSSPCFCDVFLKVLCCTFVVKLSKYNILNMALRSTNLFTTMSTLQQPPFWSALANSYKNPHPRKWRSVIGCLVLAAQSDTQWHQWATFAWTVSSIGLDFAALAWLFWSDVSRFPFLANRRDCFKQIVGISRFPTLFTVMADGNKQWSYKRLKCADLR